MKTEFTKKWIIEKGIPIVESYNGNITLRALHYQLVALGMINDVAHYQKVVNSMISARWDGLIAFDAFLDHERQTIGKTDYEGTDVDSEVVVAKQQIKSWATSYHKNRWENQPYYPEVFIEKKALQGVFEETCREWDVRFKSLQGLSFLNVLE